MKIVIAPDSFKGSLPAIEAGAALERGVKRALPDCLTRVVPMADGGEGTLQCLIDATGGKLVKATVLDPLGREVETGFGILGDGTTCVIELAMSSGLYLLREQERNPLAASTYGFGQLIRAGLDEGGRRFILCLGGSATNDGGAGMLQALGVELLDAEGRQIPPGGGQLSRLAAIRTERIDPRLRDSAFIAACDVDNPLVGPNGASHVFGPQKGATPEMAALLDDCLNHFGVMIEQTTGCAVRDVPGTGAAGGISASILAFLRGELRSGVRIAAEVTQLETHIRDADLVITGEGQVDFQTAHGKTPCGVANVAQRHGVPVVVVAGSVGKGIESLYEQGVNAVVSLVNRPMSLEEAMSRAEELLVQAGEQVARIFVSRGGRAE